MRNIVVIGGSAGGFEALRGVLARLPADLEASVFVVLHTSAHTPSALANILQRHSVLPVQMAEDGARILPRTITVAIPDYHLVLDSSQVRLTRGPRENRHRPSIDVLFRSAAYAHSARVIGTILSGSLDDGTAGLWWIRDRGGVVVAQDPTSARFPSMPSSAIRYTGADHVLPAESIGVLLSDLVRTSATPPPEAPAELETEVAISFEEPSLATGILNNPASAYTCPECHGVLFRVKLGGVPRFRCHTGHAYSLHTLLADVSTHVEQALWNALRAAEEEAILLAELAAAFKAEDEAAPTSLTLRRRAAEATARIERLRALTRESRPVDQERLLEPD